MVKHVALAVLLLAVVGMGACGKDERAQPPVETTPAVSETSKAPLVGLVIPHQSRGEAAAGSQK